MKSTRTFEELCILASRERWCWKIPCTTCGNQDFRLALRELAEGSVSPEWWSGSKNRVALHQRLRHLDALRPWPLPVQQALVEKVAPANLSVVAWEGRFADWLGLLGVALQLTEEAEELDHALTRSWGRQLSAMLPRGERAQRFLENPQSALTWRDLELLEVGLQPFRASAFDRGA